MTDIAIKSHDLTRKFGNFTAVDHLNIALERGRISGFLGPNGSGKSTTIRMLCGLLTPTEGQVEVLGLQIPRDAEKLRWKVGYMTQNFSLYKDMTCSENLDFMAEVYGLYGKTKRQRIEAAIREYSLADIYSQRAGTMSGGQRQRLALAATTLHRPEILLLDEPTSAVDPQSRRDFWEQLFGLADQGTTILVSTHYMDEAERCHQLIFLDQGSIVAQGSPQQLIKNIDAKILEIESEKMPEVRQRLEGMSGLRSITQLGSRLRLIIDMDSSLSPTQITERLKGADNSIKISEVRANLEDVFVVSTQGQEAKDAA